MLHTSHSHKKLRILLSFVVLLSVYSYEFVICGHHHCCLPTLVDDTQVLSVFYSFHKFIETFLKLFYGKNFHLSKGVGVCKTIITYLSTNHFKNIHKLVRSLTIHNSFTTLTGIQIELAGESIHNAACENFFGVGRHLVWSRLLRYYRASGGGLSRGFFQSGQCFYGTLYFEVLFFFHIK